MKPWTPRVIPAVRRQARHLTRLILGLLALATAAAGAEPWFFIQLSDPQLGMFANNANVTQEVGNFEFVVANINRLRPAFVVITGDLVNKSGDATQIAEYRRIVGTIDPSIPVYNVTGNHDVQNEPTPASIGNYVKIFGPDHYAFRQRNVVGLVLDSSLIHSPGKAPEEFAEQERWLRAELARAKGENPAHIIVFQHHSWFLQTAAEPDQYFNIPLVRRTPYLALFRKFGVRYLFCGHYHRNADANDSGLEVITTAPVGKPLGGARSGLRVVIVRDDRIEHHFYDLGEIPPQIELNPAARAGAKKK
jgi:3',5'-cyclic AMP phosphodiesterase CpdA